jgi:hypothetical protein
LTVQTYPPQIYEPDLFAISDFRIFEVSNPCYFCVEIFRNEIFYDTCPFKSAAKISSANPAFGTFKSQILTSADWISSGV